MAVAGSFFAAGGWKIVLLALAVLVLFPIAALVNTLRRPRWLRLTQEGISSATSHAHSEVSWEDLFYAKLSFRPSGSGQIVARFILPTGLPDYRELWRDPWAHRFNPWMPRTHTVDIEHMLFGVDGESLVNLVSDAITFPEVRQRIETDKETVLRLLIDPPDPWPDNGAYLTE